LNSAKKLSPKSFVRMENNTSAEANTNTYSEQALNKSKNQMKREKKFQDSVERKRLLKLRREETNSKKSVGYTGDLISHTDYYFENGLRKVKPYYFEWHTQAKERWFGKNLYSVYSDEFSRVLLHDDLDMLINTGKITVNNEIKSKDYIIKNGDELKSFRHRHELPVVGDPIEIVLDNDEILAVNKPCSIPIHPCGKYRYNSLVIILLKEMGYTNLRTIFRLDRLTSGVVVFAKNLQIAKKLDQQIKERTTIKTYVCRVVGKFPDSQILVDQPIDSLSRKIGLYWVQQTGKPSTTTFERLSYNEKNNSSVVVCKPKTGRTHQIRIHLQYLGYPILNDPLYNDARIWGEPNGKEANYVFEASKTEKIFMDVHTMDSWIMESGEANEEIEAEKPDEAKVQQKRKTGEIDDGECKKPKQESVEADEPKYETDKKESQIESETLETTLTKLNQEYDENCYECKQKFKEPGQKDLVMYLHAWSYKFGDLEFKTKLPSWAEQNFEEEK